MGCAFEEGPESGLDVFELGETEGIPGPFMQFAPDSLRLREKRLDNTGIKLRA